MINRLLRSLLIIILLTVSAGLDAQSGRLIPEDTAKVNEILRHGLNLHYSHPDSAIFYYRMIFDNPRLDLSGLPESRSDIENEYLRSLIRSLNRTGDIYYFRDEYSRSEAYFQRSSQLATAAGFKDLIARACFDIGYIRYVNNNYHEAESLFRKAAGLYMEVGDQQGSFDALNASGLTYRRLGEYGMADSAYLQAMEIAGIMNDSAMLADVWINTGIIRCEQGSLEGGIELFEKALDYYERSGNKKAVSLALLNIGVVMKIAGEYDRALEYIQQSTAIEELSQQKSQLVVRYYNLADLYLDMGDNANAYIYCQKIQTVAREIGSRPFEAECNFLLGKYYYQEKEYAQAENFFKQANDMADLTSNQPLLANVFLLRAMTELESENPGRAIVHGSAAYDKANELNLINNQKDASRILSEAYEKLGNPREALMWHKTFLAHSDSISYYNQQKEIRRIEARYNHEKQEKENELLRNKTSLQEQKLRNRTLVTISLVLVIAFSILVILLLIRRNRDAKLLYEQQQMLSLQHLEEIEYELDGQKRELASKMMFLNQKNELIQRLIQRLQEIQNSSDNSSEELTSIVNELRIDSPQSNWKEFETQFTQVHPDFYKRLYEKHPELTSYEQRMCAFLRMNLNSKEISAITGRSLKSIEVTRSRIRTKLKLGRKDNLNSFLASV
jgi:tetratricopeptide (TPR) repeat protein